MLRCVISQIPQRQRLVRVRQLDALEQRQDPVGQRLVGQAVGKQRLGLGQRDRLVAGAKIAGVLIGIGRLAVVAHRRIGAAEHHPAVGVLGIGLEPGGQAVDRALGRFMPRRSRNAAGKRPIGQARQAGQEIEREGARRRAQGEHRGQAPARRARLGRVAGKAGCQDAALDLESGGGSVAGLDQAARRVALDLREPVAIDRQVGARPDSRRTRLGQKRRQHHRQHRRGRATPRSGRRSSRALLEDIGQAFLLGRAQRQTRSGGGGPGARRHSVPRAGPKD